MVANRWFMLVVLFVARFALGFQFQSAGSVTPFIIDDFGIDYAGIGTLVGLYMIPGLFLAVPSGFIGRRFGDKRIVLLGLGLMLIGGAIAGAAKSYDAIIVGRLLSGVGAVFLAVLMTKMVTDWFVGRELFVGMSIFIIGWPIGIAAGQAVQGPIAEASSWSVVFYMTAIGCAIAIAAIAAFYRSPPSLEIAPAGSLAKLSGRELWLVCIAGLMWMLINGAYLVVLSFGPTLLLEAGTSIAEAGLVVSLMSWVFMFSLPLGGYLATRYAAPNIVMVLGLLGTVIVGGMIPYTSLPMVTFALFGIALAVAVPVLASLAAEVLRPENRGPGFGIYYIWYYAGSAFLPVVGGYLMDATGSAAASFLFAAAMMFACLLLLGLFRIEQIRLPVATNPVATKPVV